jgi:hypothetical protein
MKDLFIHFSHWIILWFILYKFKIIKYNPKLFVLFGLIDNIIGVIITIIINKKQLYEYIGISVHIIIKFLMFYSLRNSLYTMNDFMGGILFYLIYNIYLKIRYNLTIFQLKTLNLQKNKINFS